MDALSPSFPDAPYEPIALAPSSRLRHTTASDRFDSSNVVRKIDSPTTTGDECPGSTATRQRSLTPGPKVVGRGMVIGNAIAVDTTKMRPISSNGRNDLQTEEADRAHNKPQMQTQSCAVRSLGKTPHDARPSKTPTSCVLGSTSHPCQKDGIHDGPDRPGWQAAPC